MSPACASAWGSLSPVPTAPARASHRLAIRGFSEGPMGLERYKISALFNSNEIYYARILDAFAPQSCMQQTCGDAWHRSPCRRVQTRLSPYGEKGLSSERAATLSNGNVRPLDADLAYSRVKFVVHYLLGGCLSPESDNSPPGFRRNGSDAHTLRRERASRRRGAAAEQGGGACAPYTAAEFLFLFFLF